MKTTKKIVIAAAFVVAGAIQVNAQGAYINVGLGFGMASGAGTIGTVETTSNEEGVYGSYGQGINFGAGIGYMFNENVGAELGINYLAGKTFETAITDISSGDPIVIASELKGKMIRLMPAIKITAGDEMKPYAKFGLVLGMGTKIEGKSSGAGSIAGTSFTITGTDELSGGSALGWMGAFGMEFSAGDKLSVYVEINNINMSYAPAEDKWTATVAVTGSTPQSEAGVIKFSDSVSSTSVDTELKEYYPFGSFGIGAGILYNLGD